MSDWKNIVSKIAPVLGTALGGPLGGLAGTALSAALGLGNNPSDTDLLAAMQSPDNLVKLKQAELDFKSKLAELGVREEDIAAQDRKSARDMQAAIKSIMPNILATLIVVSYFILQWFVLTQPFPAENHDTIMRMLGVTDSALTLVLSFYFGSSAGSRAKDDTIQSLSS